MLPLIPRIAFCVFRKSQPLVVRWTTLSFGGSLIGTEKNLATVPKWNPAFLVKVNHDDDNASWLNRLVRLLKVIIRSIQMAIIISPLLITAPIALYFVSFQKSWLNMLVNTIQTCGPVYTKLGQWASTRRDLFPSVLCDHLTKLQRNANIHPWHHTKDVLKENGLEECLTEIDHQVIGSGCCAQVYQAKLNDGRKVALKVLHPNIGEEFERDISFLRSLIRGISWLFPQLNWLSVKESLEEFGKLMSVQVDLRNEAINLQRFEQNFQGDESVNFPSPIIELCAHNVLVESFEEGEPIGNLLGSNLHKIPLERRKSIANKGVEMFLKMVFRHNFVHCDLHPGNILVSEEKDDLIILDPGLTASLTPKDQRNFFAVFTAVVKGDGAKVGQEILQQSEEQCLHPEEFIQEIEEIVTSARSTLFLAKIDVADLLTRVFNVLRKHSVKLEPNFTSVIISIMVLEGLGRTLDPDMDLLWAASPFLLK